MGYRVMPNRAFETVGDEALHAVQSTVRRREATGVRIVCSPQRGANAYAIMPDTSRPFPRSGAHAIARRDRSEDRRGRTVRGTLEANDGSDTACTDGERYVTAIPREQRWKQRGIQYQDRELPSAGRRGADGAAARWRRRGTGAMSSTKERWQERELARLLEAESDTPLRHSRQLMLRNPEETRALDTLLNGAVWTEMRNALGQSGLKWCTDSENTSVENPAGGYGRYTTRMFGARLRDPSRPGGREGPDTPWWIGMSIDLTPYGYTVWATSTLAFPARRRALALELACEPLMQGRRPQLSWNAPWGEREEGGMGARVRGSTRAEPGGQRGCEGGAREGLEHSARGRPSHAGRRHGRWGDTNRPVDGQAHAGMERPGMRRSAARCTRAPARGVLRAATRGRDTAPPRVKPYSARGRDARRPSATTRRPRLRRTAAIPTPTGASMTGRR